jgi:hypothetical protein
MSLVNQCCFPCSLAHPAPPYPIPNPIPRFSRPLLCCHAHDAAASTAVIPPPWSSALRPSRTSSSLYIAALRRVEANSHPLVPLSLAGALLPVPPRRRPSASRRRPPFRPPQARPSLQTGVPRCPLTPHPLSPATRALPSPDLSSTELAPAGHGRRTYLREFNSFRVSK